MRPDIYTSHLFRERNTDLVQSRMLPFNAKEGFLDAIIRGFRATLIKSGEYANMAQCETLEGGDGLIFAYDVHCFTLFF